MMISLNIRWWFLLLYSENWNFIIVHVLIFRHNLPPPAPRTPHLNISYILWQNRKVSAVVHKSNQSAWFNKNLSPLNELQRYWRKNDPQHISSFPTVPQTAKDRACSQNGTSAGENGGVGIMYSELFMYNISNGKTIKWDWWRDEDNWVGWGTGGGAGVGG